MQEWFRAETWIETVGSLGEVQVADEKRLQQCTGTDGPEFVRQHDERSDQQHPDYHHKTGWRDSSDAPIPEIPQAEGSCLKVADDLRGDQVARYHEEDIDSRESTRYQAARMKGEHAHHGDGTQAIYLWAIVLSTRATRHARRQQV
jgi:hypothetical protein